MYVKPKTAKSTFVQMMDTERYLLKLRADSALRERILKHLTTSHKLMSACELFPQSTLDLDLIVVQEGKCFKIPQWKFIDSPFTQKDFRKISPRMFIPYDSTSPPEPKYFKDDILNSFLDDDLIRANFLNKFYQCLMAGSMPHNIRKLVMHGPKHSLKTSCFQVFPVLYQSDT